MGERHVIKHYRSSVQNSVPSSETLEYGEIALNYNSGNEILYIKNDTDNIIGMPFNNGTRIVEHTSTSVEVEPNVYNKWTTVSTLTITLKTPENNNIMNEYMLEFTTGSSTPSVTFPSTVKWLNTFTIEPNKTYYVSIVNNLGIIAGWSL